MDFVRQHLGTRTIGARVCILAGALICASLTANNELAAAVREPVVEQRTERQQQVRYRLRYTTRFELQQHQLHVPKVQWRVVPRRPAWWNPLAATAPGYDLVPVTTWTTVVREVELPVTRAEWVPEYRTVDVPVRVLRLAERP